MGGSGAIENLIQILGKLPGVGPRQARRFAYALTRQNGSLGKELMNTIKSLDGHVFSCALCGATSIGDAEICNVCSQENRDPKILTLIANQEDYDSLYNMDNYRGMMAIVPFPTKIETVKDTDVVGKSYIPNTINYWINKGLEEIILAYPISPEGEIMESMTIDFLEKIKDELKPKITTLGRGMSLGSRLSEADDETIKYALGNRKRAI